MITSKAASDRLAMGILPGDFVLFGQATVKIRVPAPGVKGTRNNDGLGRTTVRPMGLVTEITPSGRVRVQEEHGDRRYRILLLSAKDSGNVVKLTPEQVERRRSCLRGWE